LITALVKNDPALRSGSGNNPNRASSNFACFAIFNKPRLERPQQAMVGAKSCMRAGQGKVQRESGSEPGQEIGAAS